MNYFIYTSQNMFYYINGSQLCTLHLGLGQTNIAYPRATE